MIQLICGGLALLCFAIACGMNPQHDGSRAGQVGMGLMFLAGAVFL